MTNPNVDRAHAHELTDNAHEIQEEVLLEQEISSLKKLLALGQQKRDALLQEDMDTVVSLLEAEEDELKVLDGIRPPESKEKEPSAANSQLYQERRRIAQEVKDLNQFNQELIGDSLAYLHFMLHIIQGEDGKSIYGAKGSMETNKTNPLIDLKG